MFKVIIWQQTSVTIVRHQALSYGLKKKKNCEANTANVLGVVANERIQLTWGVFWSPTTTGRHVQHTSAKRHVYTGNMCFIQKGVLITILHCVCPSKYRMADV